MLRPATEREWSFSYKNFFFAHIEKNPKLNNSRVFSHRWALFWALECIEFTAAAPWSLQFHSYSPRDHCSVDFRGESEEGGKVESVAELFFSSARIFSHCMQHRKYEKLMQEIITKSAVGGATVFFCVLYPHYTLKIVWLEWNRAVQPLLRWLIWLLLRLVLIFSGAFFSLLSVWFGRGRWKNWWWKIGRRTSWSHTEAKMRPIQSLTVAEGWERSTLLTDCGFFRILCVNLNNDGKNAHFLCVRLFCTSLRILSRFFFVVISNVFILSWSTGKFAISKSHRLSSRQYNLRV